MQKTLSNLSATAAVLVLLASLSSVSTLASECQLEITGNDMMQYNTAELIVPKGCTDVSLTLTHVGKLANNIMGHNWVLTTDADFQAVAMAGMGAGLEKHYVPQDDARVLASTDVVGGGESTTITFNVEALSADGKYVFFCSFPGHWGVMKGILKLSS